MSTAIMRNFLSLLLVFFSLAVCAQRKPSISIKADKNKVLLGEPFHVTIEARIPVNGVVLPVKIDTIPHFEYHEPLRSDTSRSGNDIIIKSVLTLVSFDSGHWVIPSYYLSSAIHTEPLPVDVVFSDFDPNQDYHDIKDIIPVEDAKARQRWWMYIAAGALVLIVLLYFLLRKKKKPIPVVENTADLYKDTLAALDKLRASKPEARIFYSSLVGIFRNYVDRKKSIRSMQKTTEDLIIQLKQVQINQAVADKLYQGLRLSDFVKFAKYVPSQGEDDAAWESIRDAVNEIEKTP